jgi:hypothetical protein
MAVRLRRQTPYYLFASRLQRRPTGPRPELEASRTSPVSRLHGLPVPESDARSPEGEYARFGW